ncbi:DNA-processing protein DprA [Oceanirhabdus sp. W0125-5]|uniref:DNA-processing protein DprA n=1 Tax=Oceanirhabdus sp. W0125-5 TaxID=2999116 RepID=UPI0022F312E9|nr:DNA-processing protein DprA [Oceanirhabdus sp. W0125-5]WBW94818.1 DNA-processing protein DprA [Oceanirhabdus sp. W0125-5]
MVKLFFHTWLSMTGLNHRIKKDILNEVIEEENYNKMTLNDCKRIINYFQLKYSCKKRVEIKIIEEIYKKSLKMNISSIDLNDKYYPKLLKEIYDPPSVLFYRGKIDSINEKENLSIVGSRKSSHYGEEVIKGIVKYLREYNVNTISGGALGIDSLCHNYSIKNKLDTFAVLGSGLDVLYPYTNKKMFENIIHNGGAIISEFVLGTKPMRYNFPKRNRVISGISQLLLIVEASCKSGSLITMGQALEQGRDVMAVPGNIFSESSKGCNKIISEGAYVYNDITDITEILKIHKKKCIIDKDDYEKKTSSSKIFSILSDIPMHFDEIKKITEIDIRVLYSLLFEMQINDLISCINGNFYVKKYKIK